MLEQGNRLLLPVRSDARFVGWQRQAQFQPLARAQIDIGQRKTRRKRGVTDRAAHEDADGDEEKSSFIACIKGYPETMHVGTILHQYVCRVVSSSTINRLLRVLVAQK